MPIVMINKKTRKAVNVYGFVSDGLYDLNVKAVTYQDDLFLKLKNDTRKDPNEKHDKELVLVDAKDLVPVE